MTSTEQGQEYSRQTQSWRDAIGSVAWVMGANVPATEKLILLYLATGPAESDNPRALYLDPSQVAHLFGMDPTMLVYHVENLQHHGWLTRWFTEPTDPDMNPWWIMLADPRSR